MTILEYAQHVLPATRITDLEEGTSPARIQELCLCLTQALGDFFASAPDNYRRTTVSRHVSAPSTVTASLVNGSPLLSGAPFDPTWRGRSVKFADGTWNEIVAPDRLLHQWEGTTGSQSATIYPDAIAIDDFQVQRLCTHPVLVDGSGPFGPLRLRTPGSLPSLPFDPTPYAVVIGGTRRRDFGTHPADYAVEYVGQSVQATWDAVFQLRFFPIPTAAWRCQFDAELLPVPIRTQNLTSSTLIPVPDSLAHALLVPIARGRAARSPLIRTLDADDRRSLIDEGLAARAETRLLPTIFTASEALMGTPENW